ncbi:MAG: GAF domain-containing protein [Oculatellaceae cyanobacterium Prado106]|jgi:GAF domain-containing protein|nr:GAF domain-containing protein [Oculatellaceae cyanobacterium Prado106]
MTTQTLPQSLAEILTADRPPEAILQDILPALGTVLECDRCFIHVRHPATRLHRHFCWRRREDIPDTSTAGWIREEPWEQEDPMFAAALRGEPSIFVADVETVDPAIANPEFEKKLGHRALVHAHLCEDGQLWAILQPAVFDQPRTWSDFDRSVIEQMVERLKPMVLAYVQSQYPASASASVSVSVSASVSDPALSYESATPSDRPSLSPT